MTSASAWHRAARATLPQVMIKPGIATPLLLSRGRFGNGSIGLNCFDVYAFADEDER
jgi:hypothetical protein